MSISRRTFSGNALALAFASALFNPDAARCPAGSGQSEEGPHDAYEFWNGFFDSVNIGSADYHKGARAGTAGLADPAAETQYLHYKSDASCCATPPTLVMMSCSTMTEMLALVFNSRSSAGIGQ
jgi:hypothetical protein